MGEAAGVASRADACLLELEAGLIRVRVRVRVRGMGRDRDPW